MVGALAKGTGSSVCCCCFFNVVFFFSLGFFPLYSSAGPLLGPRGLPKMYCQLMSIGASRLVTCLNCGVFIKRSFNVYNFQNFGRHTTMPEK